MSKLRVDELESLETGRTIKVDQLGQTLEYKAGVVITNYSQLLRDGSGSIWMVSGKTPLPYATTGEGDGEGGNLTHASGEKLEEILQSASGAAEVGTHTGKSVSDILEREHGVSSDFLGLSGSGDVSDVLNSTAIDYINTVGANTLLLDKSIQVNSLLHTDYANVAIRGASVLSKVGDNVLEMRRKSLSDHKTHLGKINFGSALSDRFYHAVHTKKSVKIVLFGDSISYGPDFDSFLPQNTTAVGGGIDNPQHNNSLAKVLYNELINVLPSGVRVRLYVRSMPGYSYAQIDQPWDSIGGGTFFAGREQATPGKSWRDCVLDLEPDLVIHSMGMNHSGSTMVQNFLGKWQEYLSSKLMLDVFDQAILTTPNPYFGSAGQYGDFRAFELNATKFFVAAQQRLLARRYGYGIIDVAAMNCIKRYGFEPRSVTMATRPKRTLEDAVLSRTSESIDVTHPENPLYSSIEFNISFLGDISGDSSNYNDFRVTVGSAIFQIIPGKVTLYPHVGDHYSPYTEASFVFEEGETYRIKLDVLPSEMTLYVDNKVIVTSKNTMYSSTIGTYLKNLFIPDVRVWDLDIYAQHFPRLTADTPSKDIFGSLDWSQNEFGGGVNHPSAAALAEIYLPPMREFLLDAISVRTTPTTVIPNSIGSLVFIGKARNTTNCYSYFKTQYHFVEVFKHSSGFIVTGSSTSQEISVTPDGRVYMAIKAGYGITSPEWSGDWEARGLVSYNGVADNPPVDATISYPKDYPLTTHTHNVNGVNTYRGAIDVSDGSTSKTYSVAINTLTYKVIGINGSVVLKGTQTDDGSSRGDTVDIAITSTHVHFKYVFGSPASAASPRRCFYEYTVAR